jgi:hypothetical protein
MLLRRNFVKYLPDNCSYLCMGLSSDIRLQKRRPKSASGAFAWASVLFLGLSIVACDNFTSFAPQTSRELPTELPTEPSSKGAAAGSSPLLPGADIYTLPGLSSRILPGASPTTSLGAAPSASNTIAISNPIGLPSSFLAPPPRPINTSFLDPMVFDVQAYLHYNPDLATSGWNADQLAAHWLKYGIHEGRRASYAFSVREYLEMYPDLRALWANDFPSAIQHYLGAGRIEGRGGAWALNPLVFDWSYYVMLNPDLESMASPEDLARHWITHGLYEGRVASRTFSIRDYMSLYSDIRAAWSSQPDLVARHYAEYGIREGRDGKIWPASETRILGPEELVYSYAQSRCVENDVPDSPAHAFRDANGKIQLMTGSPLGNFRMIGDSLTSLKRDCHVTLPSHHNADPSQYDDNAWIYGTYTPDGNKIYALVHSEFHGWEHGMCNILDPNQNLTFCWFNSVNLAISNDAGATYTQAPSPNQVVARLPYAYAPDGTKGVFNPSNIIKSPIDGYYYATTLSIRAYQAQGLGTCVMRTKNLDDPRSWRAWDGNGFNVSYYPSGATCAVVSSDTVANMANMSIAYSTYFNQYIMLGSQMAGSPKAVDGIYYTLSNDMVHWGPEKLLLRTNSQGRPGYHYAYPSLIDPSDTSRNFERVGQSAYLYMSRFNKEITATDVDLVRISILFNK